MRRATSIATVTVLILAGVIVKVMVAPSKTVADTTATKSSTQSTISIYDLHITHPSMKNLSVGEPPWP
jgi:hypothetical protein